MSVLFGHPAGNPNSFHAALAHFESGKLEVFCLPWMPSKKCLHLLRTVPGSKPLVDRLSRRHFPPLSKAPKVQGRFGEWRKLVLRAMGKSCEGLSYEANDWLMTTMLQECRRTGVTVVHSYEDCSFWQFEEAKRLDKACIYDMPIGYYPSWEKIQADLVRQYSDWLPMGGLPSSRWVRPEQKMKEMELADLVLVPSKFVADSICTFQPDKKVVVAPYGVDFDSWTPPANVDVSRSLTFLFVGQCSLRKGIPLLLDAWRTAEIPDARLMLIGSWQLSDYKRKTLPPDVLWLPPQSHQMLSSIYQSADLFVFPTNFEGRALVVGEALASGLPVLTTPASGAEDLIDSSTGRIIPTDDLDALVEALRWFSDHRDVLPAMRVAAREAAESCTWENYRHCVTAAVAPFV